MYHEVKYKNIMNELKLGKFKGIELDFLMALCHQFRDKGSSKIEFTFAELRQLTNFTKLSNREIYDIIDGIGEKIVGMKLEVKTEKGKKRFVLFIDYEIADDCSTYALGVHPDFSYVLNDISSEFTTLDLETFVNLKSKHSKNLYRLLRQFDSSRSEENWRRFTIEDFKERLGLPESYTPRRIKHDIIDPAIDEIRPYFEGLTCDVTKARRKGAPVTGYEFRWKPAVNDQLPGQRGFSSTEEFNEIVKDMDPSDRRKVTKVAADIVKGEKKAKKPNTTFHQFDMKHNYDFENMEAMLLDRSIDKNS